MRHRRPLRRCEAGGAGGAKSFWGRCLSGKRARRPLALAVLLLLLTGCTPAQEPAPSQTPTASEEPSQTVQPTVTPVPAAEPLALAWDPDSTLVPLEANAVNRGLAPLVFEGLFALDGSFQPQNVLCSSYSQTENGLSWTFTLRDRVTFSDGTPLTGEIAARCLNEARDSDLYRSRLSNLAAVRAGEGSVTVELSTPCGALPALLDVPIFLAQEEGYPLGTGPYRFEKAAGELRLGAAGSWWQGQSLAGGKKLPAEQILLRQTPTAGDRIAAFDTGRVTLADTDFNSSSALGYAASCETWDYPTSAMLYLGFNLRTGPCADIVVRQAAARCLDREEIAATLLAGHADAASLPVHPLSGLYDETLARSLDYAPQEGARLLAEGGWLPDEEGALVRGRDKLELRLLVSSENPARTALAEQLAGELEALGAAVTVERLTWENFLRALERGEFDLYVAQVKLTADFDLTALLTGELNYGGLENGEITAMLTELCAAGGYARKSAARTLYSLLVQDVPIVPVCFPRGTVLTQWGRLSGLTPVQGNPFYGMENWVVT